MDQNAAQKRFWSGSGGENWAKDRIIFDRRLQSLGDATLQKLDLKIGMDVVDIGCGSGTTTFDIAIAVGETGSVIGLDISEPMLKLALERIEKFGLKNVKFLNQDVQISLLNEKIFDAAFSRFGVMFFDRPVKAFANINRALRVGGRLAFVCFQSPQKNLWASLSQKIIEKHLGIKMFEDKRAPSPFAFQEKLYILEVLEKAGFVGIVIEEVEKNIEWYSGITVAQAVDNLFRASPAVADKLKDADVSSKALIRGELEAAYAEHYRDGSISFPVAVWIVSAISAA